MAYDVRIESFAQPRPTAIVRRRAPIRDLPKVVPDACGVVWKAIKDQQIPGAGRHVALYLDDQVNLEVGVELEAPLPPTARDPLIASALPAGAVASTTHFGPYQQLPSAHNALRAWCAQQGHTLAGPNWEIYDHWQDAWNADPSRIRTDIYYLLK